MLHKFEGIAYISDDWEAVHKVIQSRMDVRLSALCALFCHAGSMSVVFSGKRYTVEKGQLLICLPTYIMSEYTMSDDFRCSVICIHERKFEELLMDCFRFEPNWWEKQHYLKEHPVFSLSEHSYRRGELCWNLIKSYCEEEEKPYHRQILRHLLQAMSVGLLAMLDDGVVGKASNPSAVYSQPDKVFRNFIELLQKDDVVHRSTQWYAEQLLISPKYLAEVCKTHCGKTASRIINDICQEQIKNILIYSDMPLKEISDKFGFPNVSFFGKYVRERLGEPPLQYRKNHQNHVTTS